jgi:hypothetical protein
MTANISAQGGEAQINLFEILAENGKESLTITPFELNYYESLLDHTVRLSLQVADTGYRTKTSENAVAVRSKDLDGRHVNLKITDAYQNELKFLDENKLRISTKKGIQESVNKMFFTLHLTSSEYHDNPKLRCAVTKNYDGHPDESVKRILKEYIQTKKNIDADPTLNTLSFTGKSQSPFYLCTWLASRSVPNIQNANQNLAGYFFYETADGYKFKSIDKLFAQTPKRKIIMNQVIGEIPPGYDGKILEHSFVETFDLNHLMRYASGQSQIRTFDPFSQTYVQKDFNYQNQYKQNNIGGTTPIEYGKDQNEVVSRYFAHLDTGVKLPGTVEEQLKQSNKVNYNPYDIFRQAKMRYNSLYNIKLSIVIAGDLSLRAGDLMYCDFPEVSGEKLKVVSSEKSGLYMIHDVCHRITKNGFFSGINLVRESIGRKPF